MSGLVLHSLTDQTTFVRRLEIVFGVLIRLTKGSQRPYTDSDGPDQTVQISTFAVRLQNIGMQIGCISEIQKPWRDYAHAQDDLTVRFRQD